MLDVTLDTCFLKRKGLINTYPEEPSVGSVHIDSTDHKFLGEVHLHSTATTTTNQKTKTKQKRSSDIPTFFFLTRMKNVCVMISVGLVSWPIDEYTTIFFTFTQYWEIIDKYFDMRTTFNIGFLWTLFKGDLSNFA